MIHEGTFDIYWGLKGENHTTLSEGDVVSVPTHCFRGFENIGEEYDFFSQFLVEMRRGASNGLCRFSKRQRNMA